MQHGLSEPNQENTMNPLRTLAAAVVAHATVPVIVSAAAPVIALPIAFAAVIIAAALVVRRDVVRFRVVQQPTKRSNDCVLLRSTLRSGRIRR